MPPNSETLLCRYHYDPLDRLVDTTPLKQDALQRFYCKSRLATEIQGQVWRSIFQQNEHLLAQQEHQGDTVLLATAPQRSVLHTVSAHQQRPIVYTPYGHRPIESALLSLLGFNGERPDPFTGHYLLGNGYRAFNPVLMRFNSPDSLSPFGKGGLNGYAYCLGDPVNNSDPTGHAANPFLVAGIWAKWKSRAVSNLTIPVGGRVTHTYTVTSPDLLSILDANPATTPSIIQSTSSRYAHAPDLSVHDYASGKQRLRIVNPTYYQKKFNELPGRELENILNTQQPPDVFEGLKSISSQSAGINFSNHMSDPRAFNRATELFSDAHFDRINTALKGEVLGVMPSRATKHIVNITSKIRGGKNIPRVAQQYLNKYPWLVGY